MVVMYVRCLYGTVLYQKAPTSQYRNIANSYVITHRLSALIRSEFI